MIDFSILIPNLGYEDYIFDCLDSVFSQTNTSGYTFEVIMCDQSDTDVHSQLKKTIEEKYGTKVNLLHSPIKSLYKARHTLMQCAKGRYTIFIDSDDYYLDGFLDRIYTTLSENPSIDILIHKWILVDEYKNIIKQINDAFDYSEENILSHFLFTPRFNSVAIKVFKTNLYIYDDYQQNQDYQNGEDKFFSEPLMLKAQQIVYFKNYQYYCYRQRPKSMSHDLTPDVVIRILTNNVSKKPRNRFERDLLAFTKTSIFLSSVYVLKKNRNLKLNDFKLIIKSYKRSIEKLPIFTNKNISFPEKIFLLFIKIKLYTLLYFIIQFII